MLRVAGAAYEQLGDREAALRFIGRALARGFPPALIEKDLALEALRADLRYARPAPVTGQGAGGAS